MKKLKIIALIATVASLALVSCGGNGTKKGGGTKKFTSQTGWKENDKSGWFFTPKKQKVKGWPGMVYVEGGTFVMGLVKDDVMHDWNNSPKRMQVSSYFIGDTETTNSDYRRYTTWLKFVFPPSVEDFKNIYSGALPDTLVWNNKMSRNDYAENYFRSPEFDYYPVVGVSWLQASRYCDWLTDRANEKELMNKGLIKKDFYTNDANNQGPNSFNIDKFKSNDEEMKSYINQQRVQKASGITSKNSRIVSANRNATGALVTNFRLPTEVEWEYAALGLQKNREYNSYLGKVPEIDRLKGKKGSNKGMFLDNFKRGRGDYSGIGGWGNDGAPMTADVRQYPSNDLGIYSMYGNVAEWTADIYRPVIDEEGADFNYYRGKINQEVVRGSDGKYKKIENNQIKYDTLSDGRLVYKGLPGKFERKTIEDLKNYKDGDFMSSLESGYGKLPDSTMNYNMYNGPKRKFYVDASGKVILKKDPKFRTTEVTNNVRVVKGGSWLDSSYWLDPGQRRYKDEKRGYGWVGFRVAQDAKNVESKRKKRG